MWVVVMQIGDFNRLEVHIEESLLLLCRRSRLLDNIIGRFKAERETSQRIQSMDGGLAMAVTSLAQLAS